MKRLHVSRKLGNDVWSGTLAAPNADGSDGPLRTLAAAQTAVRRIKRDLAEPETIEVVLGGGCYTLAQTWRFGGADSGFGFRGHFDGRTFPVIWRAADGESVTISGGRRVGGWRAAGLNGRAAWRAETPWLAGEGEFFRQLWIDGERRPRARLPKKGTYRVAFAPDAVFGADPWKHDRRGAQRFGFRPGELSADWSNIGAIDVQFRGLWISPRVRLREIDEAAAVAHIDRDSHLRLAYSPDDGLDYILENVLEALTEPGEWCLDPSARCVWYLPRPGERLDAIEAVAGGIERLLELRDARFVRFENILFAHAEWTPDQADAVWAQSSVTAPGAVVVGGGCEAVTFEKCRIAHVGGYGLECADGAAEVEFRNGAICDLGAGGVKIWHGCRRCVIDGCEIADGGHLWMSGAGVVIGKAGGNAVTHCHIHDFYYTGVSVGWTWGYAESDAYGNVIEWNHIHDLGKGLLSDMGGVYLLGNAAGTRVRHNRIHDIRSLRYGGWAMYPDEGSSDLLIENNLCYNTDREVFHQHYGRNNRVRNNIFAYGGEAALAYTRMEEHLGLIFEHNIFVARGTPIAKRVDDARWRSDRTRFDGNLYWCEDGEVRFEGGWRNLATQPVKARYADEAERFRPLPASGATMRELSVQGGNGATVSDAGEFRFDWDDKSLTVTGRFAGSPGVAEPGQPPWGDWRAHVAVFLKPFASCPAIARFVAAADGECALHWYGCDAPKTLVWRHETSSSADGWTAAMTVPLETILAWIRSACAVPGGRSVEWCGMAGVSLPVASLDFAAWQRHTGDLSGRVADPGFADPHRGDFGLRPDSPALALGFVPFACP